ncbi:MAG TPA: RNA polymerase factor sigma-54 [Planctomycetota bacterium]|nr:RNA polymerase factor sigma-54 [Planctomycetota bacterium]
MARPSLGVHLQQSLGQHMLLLPRMLQSIELLQLPAAELEGWLRQAAEENEALVLRERPPPGDRALVGSGRRGTREDSQRHDEMLQNQPDRGSGSLAQIEAELSLLDVEPPVRDWARFLAGCLDERGYLSAGDERLIELAREAGLEGGSGELERAIAALQSLEPRGIGARNAVQALILQLDPDDPQYALLRALLEDFLEELAKNRLPAVARAMGLTLEELRGLIERLRELEPRPAAALGEANVPPIAPDVIVEEAPDGTFEVRVESSGVPVVRIDPRIESLARDRLQSPEVKSYVRGKIDRARWIVEALEQRGVTLGRIARALFEHQKPFLEHGPGHLLPLRMRELASELGLHVSTVSRAVAAKHVQTPWGIFPLRHFFQGSAGGGESIARDDVREAVREVFASEDPHRPFADDEVVERLRARGLELARRTVTKYRRELGIPSSYRRRAY